MPARCLCRVLVAVFVVVVCPQSTALVGPGYLAGSAGGRSSPEASVVLEGDDDDDDDDRNSEYRISDRRTRFQF